MVTLICTAWPPFIAFTCAPPVSLDLNESYRSHRRDSDSPITCNTTHSSFFLMDVGEIGATRSLSYRHSALETLSAYTRPAIGSSTPFELSSGAALALLVRVDSRVSS